MKRLIYLLSLVFIIGACSDNLTDLNEDTKNPEEVPYFALLNNSMVLMFDHMASTNVNENNFRLWAQHWAQTTYPDESNYELVERNVNGRTWDRFYATILRDLSDAIPFIEADEFLTAEQKQNQYAIIDILKVMANMHLVDVFGNVPYTEAFTDANTPKYDDAMDIYWALMPILNKAITDLSGDSGLGGNDLVYGGDTEKWKMLGNSIKLRMAIRLADLNPGMAQTMAESSAPGVFQSSADNFTLYYSGSTPNTNPLWESLVESGRSDFVCANTLADYMNALNDPRRQFYFQAPFAEPDSLIGGTYGSGNTYSANSHAGALLEDPTFPASLMDYTEIAFLLADANERGWNVGGTAEDWYNIGVTESIVSWGASIQQASDYLAQADVAYATAPGSWKEKIAMQKWLAHYNQGFEAWTTWRMYDHPVMNTAVDSGLDVPFRFTYPRTEADLNGDNMEAAGDAMGGDGLYTKIFWDVN